MSDYVLEVSRLRKQYQDQPVLKDVSFRLEPGTATALIGPRAASFFMPSSGFTQGPAVALKPAQETAAVRPCPAQDRGTGIPEPDVM